MTPSNKIKINFYCIMKIIEFGIGTVFALKQNVRWIYIKGFTGLLMNKNPAIRETIKNNCTKEIIRILNLQKNDTKGSNKLTKGNIGIIWDGDDCMIEKDEDDHNHDVNFTAVIIHFVKTLLKHEYNVTMLCMPSYGYKAFIEEKINNINGSNNVVFIKIHERTYITDKYTTMYGPGMPLADDIIIEQADDDINANAWKIKGMIMAYEIKNHSTDSIPVYLIGGGAQPELEHMHYQSVVRNHGGQEFLKWYFTSVTDAQYRLKQNGTQLEEEVSRFMNNKYEYRKETDLFLPNDDGPKPYSLYPLYPPNIQNGGTLDDFLESIL